MTRIRLLILTLSCLLKSTCAAASDLKSDWAELSVKVDNGYKKALRCEAGMAHADKTMCKDFNAYMSLMYTRIGFLGTNMSNLPPQQLQQVVSARDYEAYKLKLRKMAEVSGEAGN